MFSPDDPTLSLIARFVGSEAHPGVSDAEFLLRQVAEIEQYVERFPAAQREQRALQWIEANALKYRKNSEKQATVDGLARARCADCPLAGGSMSSPCSIHGRWLKLLRLYAASELSSHDYVEKSLELLATHKDHLKIKHCREAVGLAARALAQPI